ncbi:MAG TPA: prolyl oligopeptidase family serine peptidase [Candidatus Dormibacteraeota bacterium]|nr:prolyl oligopeptidase family serine peptidase [Candidatus Dormibacteraeota bacterium]
MSEQPSSFAESAAFTALPRVSGLALSPDGRRLIASIEEPDSKRARFSPALWEIDPEGRHPARRLTWSERGESSPAFLPDGGLLFVSTRGEGDDAEAALWRLPAGGEAQALAKQPGGIGGPVVAARAGTVLVRASRPAWADGDGTERRALRKERKVTAILHTGMPIRSWDHELGDISPRLLLVEPDGGEPVDLAVDAGFELVEAGYDLSADGRTAVATWSVRQTGGHTREFLAVIDVPAGTRRLVDPGPGRGFGQPRLSPDGRRLAVTVETEGDYTTIGWVALEVRDLADLHAPGLRVDLGDVHVLEYRWAPDGATLYVTGDWHGRGAVLAVDAATGHVARRLVSDASYGALCPSPDGAWLYALRSAVSSPPAPVRLDVTRADQEPLALPSPAAGVVLPGTAEEIETTAPDGATLRAWLCLPPEEARPAPLMLWIHGGPHSSWNSWSWRWNPWMAVARGYAVLLPDPALSTGYGPAWYERAWPRRAPLVWRDLETVLDAALERPDLDGSRTACLGGSFGGFMTNWVAGHTDRFQAIVTHAGLWALDQQHATTDAASHKTRVHGLVAEHPDWYADNSPNNFVDAISTPVLIVHGNRDYRVPYSEALRMWWDLVSRYDGPPEELPHRFLQFTGENHWILSPANAEVWYDTVLGFCDQHVLGRPPRPSPLL